MKRDAALLERVRECYDGMRTFRANRERCKKFCYGEQWDDLIENKGVMMRERDYLISQGNLPMRNNLIRRLVRNVLGVYRNRWSAPHVEGSGAYAAEAVKINRQLEINMHVNRLEEVYARTLEDFLIGGLVIHRKWYGRRDGASAVRTDIVQPDKFFFDRNSRDFRGGDLTLVGELHTVRFDELAAGFARTPAERDTLRKMYGLTEGEEWRNMCEIYEVWERRRPMRLYCHDHELGGFSCWKTDPSEIETENNRRRREGRAQLEPVWRTEEEWHYSFLTPDGHVLREGVSPYTHGSHPFVFKAYPYIDGEIHSFVGDVIDQQKLANRLITMYDWILRASAKGVLLFPEGCVPEGGDISDMTEEWSKFNGVIVYKARSGMPMPQQVNSSSADIGITELLQIQMKMMEDISGVNGALQGKLDNSSMSGTLYNQQTRNSLTALADLLRSYEDFMADCTRVDVSNLRQYGDGDSPGLRVVTGAAPSAD